MTANESLLCELRDGEFKLLREVILKECGINLTEKKKALMQSRLIKRLRALKLHNYSMYYEFLMKNYDAEIVNLINCITTNKTDFFREPRHFEFIRTVALPKFEKSGKDSIKIWSAGCSTGEEAYSIAITIQECFLNKSYRPDVKILATDIDTNVLNAGINGIYKKELFENVDPGILRKYFLKGKGDDRLFYARDALKSMIYFRRLNLLDKMFPMKGKFDLIFCRNVIIYFDTKTREELLGKFYSYLADDGYFFAGHSENLTSYSNLYSLQGNTIYSKVTKCIQQQINDLIKRST